MKEQMIEIIEPMLMDYVEQHSTGDSFDNCHDNFKAFLTEHKDELLCRGLAKVYEGNLYRSGVEQDNLSWTPDLSVALSYNKKRGGGEYWHCTSSVILDLYGDAELEEEVIVIERLS